MWNLRYIFHSFGRQKIWKWIFFSNWISVPTTFINLNYCKTSHFKSIQCAVKCLYSVHHCKTNQNISKFSMKWTQINVIGNYSNTKRREFLAFAKAYFCIYDSLPERQYYNVNSEHLQLFQPSTKQLSSENFCNWLGITCRRSEFPSHLLSGKGAYDG